MRPKVLVRGPLPRYITIPIDVDSSLSVVEAIATLRSVGPLTNEAATFLAISEDDEVFAQLDVQGDKPGALFGKGIKQGEMRFDVIADAAVLGLGFGVSDVLNNTLVLKEEEIILNGAVDLAFHEAVADVIEASTHSVTVKIGGVDVKLMAVLP